MSDKKYLTVKQAADILQVDPRTLRRYLKEGEIPGIKLGNRWRIDRDDLDEFMKERKNN